MSKIEEINNVFKVPIFYNEEKMSLKENIISDLELIKNIDLGEDEKEPDDNKPMYNHVFQPKTCFGAKVAEQLPLYYTTDTTFLKETQTLLKKLNFPDNGRKKPDYDEFIKLWDEIKNDTGFKERYYYLDWDFCENLNNSETFLQMMSIYNLASPVLSFFIPVIILIIPFFILKFKGVSINMTEYVGVLKTIASNHSFFKIFVKFNDVSFEQKMYLLVSTGFYFFSIYQNVLTCIRFNNNMKKIHGFLKDIREYIDYSIDSMNYFLTASGSLNTYSNFNNDIKKNILLLHELRGEMSCISEYSVSFKKVFEIGKVLRCFYKIYNDKDYNDAFLYSFGFNGYIDNVEGLIENIKQGNIHFAKYTKKSNSKSSGFRKLYYPTFMKHGSPVKNNVKIDKNIIITGPNASGKTTVLKSTLINILLSQQFGCGTYDDALLKPYKFIHCYLNIPDTSGRDSLFQAEARRCKEIIDVIRDNKKERHFCVFDEIYSGTNPDEAVTSAFSFMTYLSKYKNVNSLLTTHFIKVCKKLDKNPMFKNYCMQTSNNGKNLKYNYLLEEGISEVKGGFKVLYDMDYPTEILNSKVVK